MKTFTVDYTQDLNGRWSARFRDTPAGHLYDGHTTPSRLTVEDCVADVYDFVSPYAKLEVGDVREHPAHGLFEAFA